MSKNKINPIGSSWDDFKNNIFTPAEIAARDMRVSLISAIINARQVAGMTQKELEEKSGVRQPIIARLEKGITDPQLSTMLKVLASFGKTLTITDIPIDKPIPPNWSNV